MGLQHNQVHKKGGPVEKIMNYSKRMLQKHNQENRKTHGKTISSTSKNNRLPKKYP